MFFNKVIEFSCQEDYLSLKEDFPEPIKYNIPDWYKKLKHTPEYKTIKGCMPFLDTLTSGYLLKMPQDFRLRHNVLNDKNELDSFSTFSSGELNDFIRAKNINLNIGASLHSNEQLKGSPLTEKNKNFPFYKILNPWLIKTPPGYSCLFVPPLNNSDDRFNILPGIVDTDSFNLPINFPVVINGDKYNSLDTIIKKGTPYVQILPFKRDNWKMKIKELNMKNFFKNQLSYNLNVFNVYKNLFWKKKSWK